MLPALQVRKRHLHAYTTSKSKLLYDYENQNLKASTLCSSSDGVALFKDGRLLSGNLQQFQILKSTLANSTSPLICLLLQKKSVAFELKEIQHSSPFFNVVNYSPNNSIRLAEKGVFKLGKAQFTVLKIRINKYSTPVCTVQNIDDRVCRVCLQQGECPVNNPLVSPCNCMGSIEFIHLQCLQRWMNDSFRVRQFDHQKVMTIQPNLCLMCNTKVPLSIVHKNVSVDTFYIQEAESPTLLLQRLSRRNERIFHLLSFKEREILFLGRSHDLDVVVDQISVSRCHASIQLKGSSFWLQDCKSKFGTLYRQNRQMALGNIQNPLFYQCEGVLFEMKLVVSSKYAREAAENELLSEQRLEKMMVQSQSSQDQHFIVYQ